MKNNILLIASLALLSPILEGAEKKTTPEEVKPRLYRSWVNLTRDQGFSNRIVHYGIYGDFTPHFSQKYWTFDKAEIGRKYKSIARYRPQLDKYSVPIETKNPPRAQLKKIVNYYKELDERMFQPADGPKYFDEEKAPINFNLSPGKGQ